MAWVGEVGLVKFGWEVGKLGRLEAWVGGLGWVGLGWGRRKLSIQCGGIVSHSKAHSPPPSHSTL